MLLVARESIFEVEWDDSHVIAIDRGIHIEQSNHDSAVIDYWNYPNRNASHLLTMNKSIAIVWFTLIAHGLKFT